MDDLGYQPFAGLTWYLSDDLMLGLVYRAQMDVNLEGDLNFRSTRGYSMGFSYDSSPVSDKNRTIDLPFDENYKLSAAQKWDTGKQLDFGLGATLICFGKGKVDQTSQGVRFKGEFDTNMALFLGGTVRYVF